MAGGDTDRFGGLLRQLRITAGFSQEALAERAGLSVDGVASLEAGRRNRPRAFTVGLLADALGLDPATRALFAARAAGQRAPAPAPPQAQRAPQAQPLPSLPAPLIGREDDLAVLTGLLREPGIRIVTLTGPGGVGKTSLAIGAAALAGAWFPDGVVFVPLASLRDPELVLPTVAMAFGLRDTTEAELRPRLLAHLAARHVLLVLDNTEHLLTAGLVVAELAGACPRVTILATSRAALRLRAERQLRVPALASGPAVRLFAERASAVDAGFEMDRATEDVVGQVCQRLDGMPLAIELAAARVRLLPPAALLSRLGGPLQLLTDGPRDLPERQRTIRATIDWSYSLLGDGERRLFAELAVFAGGCTLDAVEAVCRPGDRASLLGDLTMLVEQSLLAESGSGPRPRLQMQATVAEYAGERLDASADAEAIRGRHADWAVALAAEGAEGLENEAQVDWLDRLDAEQDNMRAALRWALDRQRGDIAVPLLGSLQWYWLRRGRHREARNWSDEVLALIARHPPAPALRATALRAAGWLACQRGDIAAARPLLEEAVQLSRATGDARTLGLALTGLGLAGSWGADPDRAGVTALLTEVLDLWRGLSWPVGQHMALVNLGLVALTGGDLDEAETYQRAGLAVAEQIRAPYRLGSSYSLVGQVELWRGRLDAAVPLFARALREFHSIRDPFMTGNCLFAFALVASGRGAYPRAARLIGAAAARYDASGTRLLAALEPAYQNLVATTRAALGGELFEAERRRGFALPADDAIRLALDGEPGHA
jgi:predicted ATPase/transcriptional regulator with XRE-family HTH domain